MREAKRGERVLDERERKRLQDMRNQLDGEKDEIVAAGRQHKAARDKAGACLRDVMGVLRIERDRQGLNLADMQARTGIARSAMSRLEAEPDANPTLATIARCADALGKEIRIVLADKSDENSPEIVP